MGAGIAKEFAKRYHEMVPLYISVCKTKHLEAGKIFVYNTGNQYIVNMAVKDDWRYPSQYRWISDGVKNLRVWLEELPSVENIGIPALGCRLRRARF